SLALGALDMLDRWTDDRKWTTLLTAAALASLAILQKLTVAFLFLPAAYLLAGKGGTDTFSAPAIGGISAVSPGGKGCLSPLFRDLARMPVLLFVALPPLAWFFHAAAMCRASGF